MGPIKLCFGYQAMLCQIILLILWVPNYAPANPVVPTDDLAANNDVCEAVECQEMANTIRRQMGNKQPCQDFHNYVCGNWEGDKERKTLPLKKKAVLTLEGLLGNATVSSIQLNATKKLVLAYQSCVHHHDDEEDALKRSIRKVLTPYNLTDKNWPINESQSSLPKGSDAYVEVLKRAGPRPVFSYSISSQNGKPVIHLTKPTEFYVQPLDSAILSEREDETSEPDYSNYTYYEDPFEDVKAYKTFIAQTITLLHKSMKTKDVEKVVNGIVEIEKGLSDLAKASKQTEKKTMNLSALREHLGKNFPMHQILQKDFQGLDINITEETEVVVEYLDYYETAVEFMKCNSVIDLSNYILWATIRKMAEAQGTLLHKIYVDFKDNTTVGGSPEKNLENTTTLSLRCVRQLLERNVMYTGSAHYYIKEKFNESDRKDVLEIMEFVNSTFMPIVKHNTWMSEDTKKDVMLKLQKMTPIIGYPYWMLNETIIDGLYQFVPKIRKNASFVEHFHYLLENDHKQALLQLDPNRYFDKTNEDVPLKSHAYFDDRIPTIAYPAAAIVTHYRRSPIPRSVNCGTIGTILAQLFATLMDRYSGPYKETEKKTKDTWDNTTRDNFCNRSSCLNHTEECSDTTVPSTEKYEKLHDYFGLRISYQAMEKSKKNYTRPFLLPDGKNTFDTEEKIFFIVFGSLYCPFSVNEKKVESRSDDDAKYPERLNEIVYNYEAFNKTFNCSLLGRDACDLMPPQPMNPLSC